MFQITEEQRALRKTLREFVDREILPQSAAYELTHRKDFPVCRIGGSIRIPKSLFLLWLKEMTYVPANLSEYISA